MDEPSMIPTMDERAAATANAAVTVINSSVGVVEDEEKGVPQNDDTVDCVTDNVEEKKIEEHGFEIIEDVDTVERQDDEKTPIEKGTRRTIIIHYYDRTHTNVQACIDGEDCDPRRITNEKKKKMTNITTTKETHTPGGGVVRTTTSSSTEPKPKIMRIQYYDSDNLVAPLNTGIAAQIDNTGDINSNLEVQIHYHNNDNNRKKIGDNKRDKVPSFIVHHNINVETDNNNNTDTEIVEKTTTTNRNDNRKTQENTGIAAGDSNTNPTGVSNIVTILSTNATAEDEDNTPGHTICGMEATCSSIPTSDNYCDDDNNNNNGTFCSSVVGSTNCLNHLYEKTIDYEEKYYGTHYTANEVVALGSSSAGDATTNSIAEFNNSKTEVVLNNSICNTSVIVGADTDTTAPFFKTQDATTGARRRCSERSVSSGMSNNSPSSSSIVSDRIAYYNRLSVLNGVERNEDEVAVTGGRANAKRKQDDTDNVRHTNEKLRSRTTVSTVTTVEQIDIAGGNRHTDDDYNVDGRDAVIAYVSDDEVEIEVDDIFEAHTSASEDDHNERIGKEHVNKEDIDSIFFETKLHIAPNTIELAIAAVDDNNDNIGIMNKTANNLAVSYLRTAKTTSHLVMADINKAIPYEDFVGGDKSGVLIND